MNLGKYNCNGNFYRKINAVINVILVLHQLFILCSEAYYLDNNPYRHKQVLGPKASFVVEWSVNWKDRSVLFQVSAETKGWIGFGLSQDGRMLFSDGIIGGVDSYTGKPYFNDVHVRGNRSVLVDKHQDWKLIGAWERGKRTYLSFSRSMETCDSQDYPITKDLLAMIWAYGETDEIEYHQKRRGSVPVYLLDPAISEELAHDHYRQIGPHSNLYLVQRWAVTNTLRLSARPASVWCSVERGPRLLRRHDIVGMGAFLPTKLARQHVQKMLLFKCTSPQQTQAETFFDPYVRLKGEECFLNDKRTLPLAFCRELIYVWGKGGKPFYFPEDIGIPIGSAQNEYFLLETHFDNPKGRTDLDIEAGIEVIYSHRQKPQRASLLQIGYGPFGTFMVPPGTTMSIYGSCGAKCTSSMFPKNGANIFAAMLHTRSLGRRIRLKHFNTGSTELPWILKDDNYDSEFQQMRLLSKQVTVLPGDQLTTECVFDSRDRNRTSFSGFSAHDEICAAFVYVSRQMSFFRCTSELPANQLLSKYGIHNFTWDLSWQDRYVTAPKHMEGTWLGDVVDDKFHLNKANINELQHDLKYGAHLESCPNIYDMMGHSQNQLFRTFTNNWQQSQDEPLVATRTPHITSTVFFPKGVREYKEESFCGATPIKIPLQENEIVLSRATPPPLSTKPSLPFKVDHSFPGVLRNHPPVQLTGFSTLFSASPAQQTSNPSSAANSLPERDDGPSFSRNYVPRPQPPPPAPANSFGSTNVRHSSKSSRFPATRSPRLPPNVNRFVQKRPSPKTMDKWTPIVPRPPPPPQPPTVPSKEFNTGPTRPTSLFGFNTGVSNPPIHYNFLSGNNRPNFPSAPTLELKIPMFQNKQPDLSNDKSIMKLFEQIANIFSSTSNGNIKDSFSFQHQIDNFLRRNA